ncbi:sensor histidine kinase [Streptomyces sp. NPDC012600]|uniref:sensor histidine kinase n=1 Tax=Streptomyces sp. NPDC012600 TaxID=3415005 RepID=UPI003C2B63C9
MSISKKHFVAEAAVVSLALVEIGATRTLGPAWVLPWAVVAALALPFRHRFPQAVLAASMPALASSYLWLPAIFPLYALARGGAPRARVWIWAGSVGLVMAFPWPHSLPTAWSWEQAILHALAAALLVIAPVGLGSVTAAHRELTDKACELVRSRERERTLSAIGAVIAERERIARDMHDSLAYHLSLIVLKLPADDPVRQHAVEALGEVRRTVGALETPGLAELPALVEAVGPHASLSYLGTTSRARCPLPVQQAAYRVAQEALANACRHAPLAAVRVVVNQGPDVLALTVHSAGPPTDPLPGIAPGGHGLAGLRRRVSDLHGTLHAGPAPGGGFRVRAVLPYSYAEPFLG